jgi:Excalibur calcium-binding domain
MNDKKVHQYLNFLGILVVGATLVFAVSCSNTSSSSNCPAKNCSDFSTQASAQSVFNSNRSCYKSLDSDGDGTACENLK